MFGLTSPHVLWFFSQLQELKDNTLMWSSNTVTLEFIGVICVYNSVIACVHIYFYILYNMPIFAPTIVTNKAILEVNCFPSPTIQVTLPEATSCGPTAACWVAGSCEQPIVVAQWWWQMPWSRWSVYVQVSVGMKPNKGLEKVFNATLGVSLSSLSQSPNGQTVIICSFLVVGSLIHLMTFQC